MLRRAGRSLFVARNRAILLQASTRAVGKGLTNPNVTSQSAFKADPQGTGPIPVSEHKQDSQMYNKLGNAWEAMRKVGQNNPIEKSIERYEDHYQHEGTGQKSPSARAESSSSSSERPSLWERAKDAVSAVKDAVSTNADRVKQQASQTTDNVTAKANETTETLGEKFQAAGEKFQAARENLMDKFENAKETVQDKYEGAKEAMGQTLDNVKDAAQSRTVQSKSKSGSFSQSSSSPFTRVDMSRSAMTQEIPLSEMQGNLSPEDEVLAPMAARSHQTTAFKGMDNVQEARSTEDLSFKARNTQDTFEVKRPTLKFKPEEPTAEERDNEGLDDKGAWAAPKNLKTGETLSQSNEKQQWSQPDSQQWRKGLAQSTDSVGTFKKEYNQGTAQEAMEATGFSSSSTQGQSQSRYQQKWSAQSNRNQDRSEDRDDDQDDDREDNNTSAARDVDQKDLRGDNKEMKHNISSADNRSGRTFENSVGHSNPKKQREFMNDRTRNGNDGFGNIQNTSSIRADHKGEAKFDVEIIDKDEKNFSSGEKQNFNSSNKRQETSDDSEDSQFSSNSTHAKASKSTNFDHQRGMTENIRDEHPLKEAARKTGEQLKEGLKDVKNSVMGDKKNLHQGKETKGDEGLDRHRNEKPYSSEHGERNARVPKKEPTRFGDWEHTGRTTDF